jgi:hypothetical protein
MPAMSNGPVRRRPWLAVALLASLAVNALTVGVVIGSGFMEPMLPRVQAPVGPPAWAGFGNRLSGLPMVERRRFMAGDAPLSI